MRISWILFSLFLVLLVSVYTDEFGLASARRHGLAARIPEHTCHKTIGVGNKCNLQRCIQECSKEPAGMGDCRGRICFCSYFCRDPPV